MREPYLSNPEFKEYDQYYTDGIDLARLEYNEIRMLRQDLQMIFQDPYSS